MVKEKALIRIKYDRVSLDLPLIVQDLLRQLRHIRRLLWRYAKSANYDKQTDKATAITLFLVCAQNAGLFLKRLV